MSSNKAQAGPNQSRNEYIPSFISKRPFWAETSSDADYLEHQRLQSAPKDTLDTAKWYDRGRKAGPAATKFRKGACENCGAMTHKTKECLSRPRKTGARWTGSDIQADEVIEDVKLGWDAKRDRWNGYDPREYAAVVQEYEDLEALKRTANHPDETKPNSDVDVGAEADDADAKYDEETDMGRSQPTSTRQLRLREDTANYLKNLDLESARYDPKTRTMDKSAAPELSNDGEVDVSDGFVRPATDDAAEFERAQRYAWETQETSGGGASTMKKLHLQANPTEGEILRKKQTQESAEKKAAARKALLDRYGGDEHIKASSQSKRMPQVLSSERYVEYDESGHVKGQERTTPKSKYSEDVFVNNHTSVWGSWWHDFTWGYACCHSTVRNSYCTGEAGLLAFEEAQGRRTGETLLLEGNVAREEQAQAEAEAQENHDTERWGNEHTHNDNDNDNDNDNASAPSTKVKSAPQKAKKRTLQELQSGISEEELDSYKRNRVAGDDPMASLLGKDELVEMR